MGNKFTVKFISGGNERNGIREYSTGGFMCMINVVGTWIFTIYPLHFDILQLFYLKYSVITWSQDSKLLYPDMYGDLAIIWRKKLYKFYLFWMKGYTKPVISFCFILFVVFVCYLKIGSNEYSFIVVGISAVAGPLLVNAKAS